MAFEQIATGFDRPLFVAGHPRQPDQLYVLDQFAGVIQILQPGQDQAPEDEDNFLSLSVRTNANEMGLLGFAFHPDFPNVPKVYVNYNPSGEKKTVVSEFQLDSGDASQVDLGSERVIIEIDQPYTNHNGGMIGFGPDRMLYVGMGDGGDGGDPEENGQDLNSLHGKILRIDVVSDDSQPYLIPADNPFAGTPGHREEIWAYGLRNPWRFSWDSVSELMYAGDVGQGELEEITLIEKGENYGWNKMEGFSCFRSDCDDSDPTPNATNGDGMVLPLFDYGRSTGKSVTGGYVYRSCEVPNWQGRYYFGDYVSNRMFAISWDGEMVEEIELDKSVPGSPMSFGTNAWGDVYVAVQGGLDGDGKIYRLAPQP